MELAGGGGDILDTGRAGAIEIGDLLIDQFVNTKGVWPCCYRWPGGLFNLSTSGDGMVHFEKGCCIEFRVAVDIQGRP